MIVMFEVFCEDMLNIFDSCGLNFYICDLVLEWLLEVYLLLVLFVEWWLFFEWFGVCVGGELDVLVLVVDKNLLVLVLCICCGEDLQSICKYLDYVVFEWVVYVEFGLVFMSYCLDGLLLLVKYVFIYLFVQVEFGFCCLVSMIDLLICILCRFGVLELVECYLLFFVLWDFDELFQGVMFMIEQVVGFDVVWICIVVWEQGGEWKFYGDKWFCFNLDVDLVMVLVCFEGVLEGMKGVILFLLLKVCEDGMCNVYCIVCLKDKLGSCFMVSGEVCLEGVSVYLIGEIGCGFQQMVDMVNMLCLFNGVCVVGLMCWVLSEVLFVVCYWCVFGKYLIDMLLMQKQLLKMMLFIEQVCLMFMQIVMLLLCVDGGEVEVQKCVWIFILLIKFCVCCDV